MRDETHRELVISANRDGYSTEQCGVTLTAGQLCALLEDFDPESPVYLPFDNGYTYGSIAEYDFEER